MSSRCELQPAPLALIERFLIVHERLAEVSMGDSLDEGASLDELYEQILYYHNIQKEGVRDEDTDNCTAHPAGAIQFAGLCSALRSFPCILSNSNNKGDSTHIHFNRSTLVFVPLEQQHGQPIVAIAQVSRSSFSLNRDGERGGSNLLAIRKSIERCHHLFCLLRGGGIHRRLSVSCSQDDENSTKNNSDTPYPAMAQLYSLRKRNRRLQGKLNRIRPEMAEKKGKMETESQDYQNEIQELMQTIPTKSLRAELCIHYDEYLSQFKQVSVVRGISGRCIVDLLPTPASLLRRQCPPSAPSLRSTVRLGCVVQRLLENRDCRQHTPYLLGISSFYQGHLVYTHVSSTEANNVHEQLETKETFPTIAISSKTANLVFGYMSTVRDKATHQHNVISSTPSHLSTPPRSSRPLDRLKSLVGERFEEKAAISTGVNMSSCDLPAYENASTGFLQPPPLAMLSASDRVFRTDIPFLGSVWLPRVYLPGKGETEDVAYALGVSAAVALYEHDSFSFLLYITPENCESFQGNDSTSSVALLLEHTSNLLSTCLRSLRSSDTNGDHVESPSPHETVRLSGCQEPNWAKKGESIILVDRKEKRLVLVTHRDVTNGHGASGKTLSAIKRAKRNSLKLFGIKRSSDLEDREASSASSEPCAIQWPLLGIDCRHLLTAHLPLDVILAFEGAMNDIHNASHRRNKLVSANSGSSNTLVDAAVPHMRYDGNIEICTSSPEGWIFANAQKDQELYIFFDSDKHLTIADVQKAASRVRLSISSERLL